MSNFIYSNMKYLKYYENFAMDHNVDDQATFNHDNNPVLKLAAKEYVEKTLHSNQYKIIFDDLGLEAPKDVAGDGLDELFDEIGKQAIEFYTKNPELMQNDEETSIKKMPVSGGNINTDGIPRVSSI